MSVSKSPIAIENIPPELIESACQRALQDADRVVQFLEPLLEDIAQHTDKYGTVDDLKKSFPAWFLLELAAVLQVLEWERLQCLPVDHNLPPASQLLDELWTRLPLSDQEAELRQRICHFAYHHYSWQASTESSAELLLDELDDEALVNALADFLWTHRNE